MCSSIRVRWAWLSLAFLAAGLLAGCGGPKLAPVTGKVMYNGKAVKGGTLIFNPVGANVGKAGTADINADGTYTVTTNTKGDGAVVARHRIAYTPPAQELTEAQRSDPKYIAPPPAYMNLMPKTTEVDITNGPNTVDIELVPIPSTKKG